MRMKSSLAEKLPPLRLIVSKPAPEPLSRESEALGKLLEDGVSYERQLCRDSVGSERMSETVGFRVEARCGRDELLSFLRARLGCPLSTVGNHGDRIMNAVDEAEEAGLVRLKEIKRHI
jgi:hypothetical protein